VTRAGRLPGVAWFLAAAAAILVAASAAPASAQGRAAASPRLEIGGGGGVAGAVTLDDRDANLLGNNAAGSPFRLFATASELRPAAAGEVHVGYRVTPRLTAEGRLTFSRPSLRVSLSSDVENAASSDATSHLTEYVVEGGARWRLSSDTRRWIPFVSGGAGVARHVHEERVLVENGVSGYAGGGLLRMLGSARTPAARRAGLRFDVRLQLLQGGIVEGAGVSPRIVATAGAFLAF
jgi:hypothetical protein